MTHNRELINFECTDAFTNVKTYTFLKEKGTWYIHIPEYLQQGWSIQDLAMVEGAHKLLNIVSEGRKKVVLRLSTEPFAGADELELMEHCPAPKGGAVYLMESCAGKEISAFIWICDIALFVFGDMPEHIYCSRVSISPGRPPHERTDRD